MDFRMLGPLTIRSGRSYRAVSSHRHRKLLAALLVDANAPVSTERLVDVLWGTQPPTTARQQVQNCVGSLRTVLRRAGHEVILDRRGTSYILETADDMVDGLTFRRLRREADRLACRGGLAAASGVLRTALGLWHGRALEDVRSDALVADATRLEEVRIRALEALVDLEFAQGNQVEIIADLSVWVQVYPYHEGLHCRLAEALHSASRAADALNVIRPLKARLNEELGIGLGPAVRQLEQRLLGVAHGPGDDPAGRVNGTANTPSQIDPELISTIMSRLEELSAAVSRLSTNGPTELRARAEPVDRSSEQHRSRRTSGADRSRPPPPAAVRGRTAVG